MTTSVAIGVVATIYLVVAIIFGLIFCLVYKIGSKSNDPEERRVAELFDRVAEAKGTTPYGVCMIGGLLWPLAIAKRGKDT